MNNLISRLRSLTRFTRSGLPRPVIGRLAASRVVALVLTRLRMLRTDAGMTTAEYAVGTIAACAFAAILYRVVTGSSVVAALGDLIQSALSALS